jgi:hypothetical protein
MSEFSATTGLPAPSPADIEARQDDLLRELDVLEKRIGQVLSDYAASVKSPARPATGPRIDGISQPLVAAETPRLGLPLSAGAVPSTVSVTLVG